MESQREGKRREREVKMRPKNNNKNGEVAEGCHSMNTHPLSEPQTAKDLSSKPVTLTKEWRGGVMRTLA